MTTNQVCNGRDANKVNASCPKAPGCPVLREGPAPREVCGLGQEMKIKALVLALGDISTDTKIKAAKRLAQVGGVSEIGPLAAACWGDKEMVAALKALVERHGEEGLGELGMMARETEGAYWTVLSVARAASAVKSPKAVDILDAVAQRAVRDEIYGKPPESTLRKDMDYFVDIKIRKRAHLFGAILDAIEELGVPACSALVIERMLRSPDAVFYGINERAVALLS